MDEQFHTRRIVLHAALAAGCSLCVPAALFADDAKKGAGTAGSPAATSKVPQASVHYQTKPRGDQKCSACVNFIAASETCKLVEGKISPDGWCLLWTKKS